MGQVGGICGVDAERFAGAGCWTRWAGWVFGMALIARVVGSEMVLLTNTMGNGGKEDCWQMMTKFLPGLWDIS